MPYIRVYVPKASIKQQRSMAQTLIEITLRTFHLRPENRYRISVEFISRFRACTTNGLSTAPRPDLMVEVIGHDLTEGTKRAFAEEAAAMLAEFMRSNSRNPVARLLGITPETPPKIAFQFGELNPAISEPFVVHPGSQAA